MLMVIVLFLIILISLFSITHWSLKGYRKKSEEDLGNEGEAKVAASLSKISEYNAIINNSYFSDYAGTHQIDHIYISRRGVFIIETKNISGSIKGDYQDAKWSAFLGKEIHSFINPIKQNEGHIRVIERIIGNRYPIYSIVVFARNNAPYGFDGVINLYSLKSHILGYPEQIESGDVMDISALIKSAIDKNLNHERHVNAIYERERRIENGICPICGGLLIMREGRYGKFLGCENYPRCKFTHRVKKRHSFLKGNLCSWL